MADLDLEKEVAEILDNYDADVRRSVEKTQKDVAKECADYLRQTSPKKTGEYVAGWTSKKNGDGYAVYNSAKPGLTHLLNNGHAIKNGRGSYGLLNGDGHITKAEEIYKDVYIEKISNGIEKIGG